MKNQLIVAACVVAACCSSIAFAGKPHQGEKPKTAVKSTVKTTAPVAKMSTTTVTKHTKHTKKS